MIRSAIASITALAGAALFLSSQTPSRADGYANATGTVTTAAYGLTTINVSSYYYRLQGTAGSVSITSNHFYISGHVASVSFTLDNKAIITTVGAYVCDYYTGLMSPALVTVTMAPGGNYGYLGFTTVSTGLAPSLAFGPLQTGGVSLFHW